MTCAWEPDPGCLGDSWDTLDPEVQRRSLLLATSSLQALTYYRVGTCPITIRPCVETHCGCGFNPHIITESCSSSEGFGGAVFGGGSSGGQWHNACHCANSCKPLSEIDIPGPVGYIEELRINGEAVDLWNGDWRLDDGHLLVWQGEGASPVPDSQDLNLPDTEAGTWSLTYSKSYPVLEDARLAVALLAAEFAKACQPKSKCSLPRGVTNVVRNGVTFTVQAGLFPNGLTNIDIVDQFILKWAPAGSPQRSAQVFDPRKRAPRVVSSVPARYSVDSI